MVRVQSEIKRGFLRQIAEGAKSTGATLREALLAFQTSVFDQSFRKGRIYVSTSGSGQQVSFAFPSIGQQFSQEQIFALAEEFIAVYDLAITNGAIDAADPSAIDILFTSMCGDDRLRGVRRQQGDFSGLNFPATSLR